MSSLTQGPGGTLEIPGQTVPDPPSGTRQASSDVPEDPATRFRGRGSLRGHVEVAGNEPFPTSWRLVLSPSNTLVGREFAEARVVAFEDGRQDFEVQGLPLAGYDVRAESDTFNGQSQPILLEARSPAAFVNLRMVHAGSVDGRLLDADGTPAEGVVVTLSYRADPGERAPRETTTDALGAWRFDDVLDGNYEVGIGPLLSPLLPHPRTIVVQAPGVTLPDITLPPLAALELTYYDGVDERLLTDVTVTGSGLRGGAFEAKTDSYGTLHVEHLPPGRWRLRASAPGYEDRRDQFDLEAGKTETATIGMARE